MVVMTLISPPLDGQNTANTWSNRVGGDSWLAAGTGSCCPLQIHLGSPNDPLMHRPQ